MIQKIDGKEYALVNLDYPNFVVEAEPLEPQAVEEKKVYNGYNWTVEEETTTAEYRCTSGCIHPEEFKACECKCHSKAPKEACYCNADTKCWNCATNDLPKIEELGTFPINNDQAIGVLARKINELVRAFNRLGKEK